jgi:hypothetical protein
MTAKRDLVEAHTYSRRRLVTALVTGAPDGCVSETTGAGRTLVGSLVLAVLLTGAGAAGRVLDHGTGSIPPRQESPDP